MVAKKRTTKKTQKPKVKYVTKYVERKDESPFGDIPKLVAVGAGAIVTLGVARAIGGAFNSP